MVLFGMDGADEDGAGGAGDPAWTEIEIAHVGEHESQGGVERDGQDGGHDHREVFRVSEGLEETAFLGF